MKSMDEITIPATTITEEQYAVNARQLGMAICYQAVKDYCKNDSEPSRNIILKDLRSAHMDFLSDGMSVVTADQLAKNPEAIAERLKNMKED